MSRDGTWPAIKFGDVVQNVTDRVNPAETDAEVYVGLEHLDPECLQIRRWGTPDDVIGQKLAFKKGDIIFGRRRAYQRKLAVADFDGICSAHAMVVRAKPKVVLPGFLPFLMQSDLFMNRAVEISVGSLSPTINWKTLKTQEFPLPPLDEQERLAELLWAAEEVRRSWQNVSDRLSVCGDALLGEVFDRDRCLAQGWKLERLSKLVTLQTGIAKGRKYEGVKTVVLPYLRVANVKAGYLDLEEMKEIQVAVSEIDRYRVLPGDVLLTEGGDFDKLGRGTVWRGEIATCLHQNHVFCVRPHDGLLPEFLSYQTSSPYGRRYFLKCAKKTSNLASINSTQVKAFPVLLPDEEEQKRILEFMRPVDAQCVAAVSRTARCKEVLRLLEAETFGGPEGE